MTAETYLCVLTLRSTTHLTFDEPVARPTRCACDKILCGGHCSWVVVGCNIHTMPEAVFIIVPAVRCIRTYGLVSSATQVAEADLLKTTGYQESDSK